MLLLVIGFRGVLGERDLKRKRHIILENDVR